MFAAGIAATRCVPTRESYSRPASARASEVRLAITRARPRRALRSAPSIVAVKASAHATRAGDAREPPRSRVADVVRGDDAPASRPVTNAVARALEPTPADRFQHSADFATALDGSGTAGTQWDPTDSSRLYTALTTMHRRSMAAHLFAPSFAKHDGL